MANGTTDITESNRKLFLNPLMLIIEIIIEDKRQTAIDTQPATDKSRSNFRIIAEDIELKSITDAMLDITILIK